MSQLFVSSRLQIGLILILQTRSLCPLGPLSVTKNVYPLADKSPADGISKVSGFLLPQLQNLCRGVYQLSVNWYVFYCYPQLNMKPQKLCNAKVNDDCNLASFVKFERGSNVSILGAKAVRTQTFTQTLALITVSILLIHLNRKLHFSIFILTINYEFIKMIYTSDNFPGDITHFSDKRKPVSFLLSILSCQVVRIFGYQNRPGHCLSIVTITAT